MDLRWVVMTTNSNGGYYPVRAPKDQATALEVQQTFEYEHGWSAYLEQIDIDGAP